MTNATGEVSIKGFVLSQERVHITSWRTQPGKQKEVNSLGDGPEGVEWIGSGYI